MDTPNAEMIRVSIQAEPFEAATEIGRIETALAGRAGAVVSFSGLCRDESGRLAALEIEHYPGMADDEILRVLAEAEERWPLQAACVIHRHGLIRPGEGIVLVVTASAHRKAAFAAASYLMDYLTTRAPFWKREHLSDGTIGTWVEASERDAEAAEAWG